MNNIILMTDSYKVSHWKQYPPFTQKVYSYLEARNPGQEVVFFGLQYILKQYLLGQVISIQKINEARKFFKLHFGSDEIYNIRAWEHIMLIHGGKLPLEIKAVPEGSVLPTRTVLMTVENTCKECFWLTNYVETILSQVWYPSTIATKSHNMKKLLTKYLFKTGNDSADFKLHDFGYRGSTSQESAGIGDAAHLLSFKGTDTIPGIIVLINYYNAKGMPAFSIPAAEHSTITSWGKENEDLAYENMLNKFPKGLVAVVSDSYDIFNAAQEIWGKQLKAEVEKRQGTLVIRPDSGDPKIVLVKLLRILGEAFGYKTNAKGYKVLPPYLRLIQGDGITEDTLLGILQTLDGNGWSIDNIAFGSGGGLLQDVTRDTLGFAFKCSNVTIDGHNYGVHKSPVTDPGKASKMGRFKDPNLKTVFLNGELTKDQTYKEIVKRVNS